MSWSSRSLTETAQTAQLEKTESQGCEPASGVPARTDIMYIIGVVRRLAGVCMGLRPGPPHPRSASSGRASPEGPASGSQPPWTADGPERRGRAPVEFR